jgi:plastocyanin
VIRARRALAVAGAVTAVLTGVLTAGCSNTKSVATRQPYTGSATATVLDGVQQVTLTVGPTFRFNPSTITVHPGQVKLTLHHTGTGSPHDWQLSVVPGAYIPELGDNQTQSVSFTAPAPGNYQFVCTIHLRQGQTGTLIVLPR